MGILRLYLAICVIAAHSKSVFPWECHGGREAVQIFFVVSGFYMQFILSTGKYDSVRDFYLSRTLRIYIPYMIVLVLVVSASVGTGVVFGHWLTLTATIHHNENGAAGTIIASLTNLSLFFQDWVMFIKHDAGEALMFTSGFGYSEHPLWHYLWIPQAWSVGVELTFYSVAPYLVRRISNRQLVWLIVVSLAARLFCYAQLGLAHDPWTYRFFPFEIVQFSYGIAGCRLLQKFPRGFGRLTEASERLARHLGRVYFPLLVAGLVFCLWLQLRACHLLCSASGKLIQGGGELAYLMSLSGWIVIIPVLFAITGRMKTDRFIGELSYPIYLLHYTIILICGGGLRVMGLDRSQLGVTAAGVCIVAAILLQTWVLQPVEAWRQHVFTKAAKLTVDPTRESL